MITVLARCICTDKEYNKAVLSIGPDIGLGCWFDLKFAGSDKASEFGCARIKKIQRCYYKTFDNKPDRLIYLGSEKDKLEPCDKYILFDIGSDNIIKRIYWTEKRALEELLK